MSLKKPALLFNSSGALATSLHPCTSQQHTPLHYQRRCCSTRPARSRDTIAHPNLTPKTRRYATEARGDSSRPGDSITELQWPELGSPPRAPTPYEVFCQKRGESYSKRRFYELVKLYHPDRHKHKQDEPHPSGLSHAVLLERYRLVIAANSVLSDPSQKALYDKYGTGWSSNTVADLWPTANTGSSSTPKYSTHHRWRKDGSAAYQWPPEQDPMYNATWEDWERWYRQQYSRHGGSSSGGWGDGSFFSSRRRQRGPLYASNHAFISTVFVLAALGGVGQATRAGENNRWRLERTNLVSEQTNRNLTQARQDALDRREDGETKDKRIRRFLSEHERYEPGEFDARVAREGDDSLCASGVVKDKDQPRFWERPPDRPPAKPPRKER